jgi:predicted acetyltransferase
MTDVQLNVATIADAPVLENLLQLYIHDFSEYWAGGPQGELDEDGRFPGYPLEPYWRESERVALLIRFQSRLAGFALLNAVSHLGGPVDRNMAEFFVVRKHRAQGVGAAAAGVILGRYPGSWEVAVARRNIRALAFWRRTISAWPGVSGLEETDLQNTSWNGPVFRFRVS